MSYGLGWQWFTRGLKDRMIKDLVDTWGLILYTKTLFPSLQRDSTAAAVLPKERRNTSTFLFFRLLLWDDKYLRYGFIMLCWELSLRSDWIHIIVRHSRELNCHARWPLSLRRLQNRLLVSTVLHPSCVMIEDILKEAVNPLSKNIPWFPACLYTSPLWSYLSSSSLYSQVVNELFVTWVLTEEQRWRWLPRHLLLLTKAGTRPLNHWCHRPSILAASVRVRVVGWRRVLKESSWLEGDTDWFHVG